MTSTEEHINAIRMLLKDVEDKVRSESAVDMQKIVGFSCSEASCDLFALLLHKKNLITPGFNINHRFFASDKIAKKKFSYDFPRKETLINLLVRQEGFREKLCYGREKKKEVVEKCIANTFKIKGTIEELIGETI
jgi:hypothetical protein